MTEEEKRKIFLEQLDRRYKKLRGFNRFSGPGLKRKLQRLLFSPSVYIPYSLAKIGLYRKESAGKLFWGKELKLNTNDLDVVVLASAGMLPYEPELRLTKFFIKNFKKDDIFYDIGASCGFYTHLALEFCKEVHAFEPIPEIFTYLERNLAKNKNVFLNNTALFNKSGINFLDISKQSMVGGSIAGKENTTDSEMEKINVRTITLDSYLESHNKPTIVKLDVEGAEEMVIEGGEDFFRSNDPLISIEVWPKNHGGEISMKAVEKLRGFGYKSHLINSEGELESLEGNLSEYIEVFENYIFMKPFPGKP